MSSTTTSPALTSYASNGESVIVYIFAAVVLAVTLFGGIQTIRYFKRGDINGRFPALLLFNGLCVFFFALFAIVGVGSDIDQHALNVILISTAASAFTIQLLRAIRLLFTIEVRYFISKQFAIQFAYGEAEVDMLFYEDQYYDGHSEGSENSYQVMDEMEFDEDDDDYYDDGFDYQDSLHYSASYFDYQDRDLEFGNFSDEDEEDNENSKGDRVVGADGNRSTGVGPDQVVGADAGSQAASDSLFSNSSDLSKELENEDDLGNSLGRWIFQHKSLASAGYMTGLAIFIFCKYCLLTVVFAVGGGVQWTFILWLVVLSLSVLASVLTILSLKMVRVRSYYIYERTLQDYNDKYFPQPTEEELLEEEYAQQEAEKEAKAQAELAASRPQPAAPAAPVVTSVRKGKHSKDDSSSSSAANSSKKQRTRSGSQENESSGSRRSNNGSKLTSRHAGSRIKRAENGQQYSNAADQNGSIALFGAVIAQTNPVDKPQVSTKLQQHRRQSQRDRKGSDARETSLRSASKPPATVTRNEDFTSNAGTTTHAGAQLEVDPDRPPAPEPPPTDLFSSQGDPSGQMFELLITACICGLLYSISLLIAIIYAGQYDASQYGYFTLSPTQYSPPFTRGILILLLLANGSISYSSLVHIIVSDKLKQLLGMNKNGQSEDQDLDESDLFRKILLDQPARNEFRRFLEGEFSSENLLFWNAIEEYRSRPVQHFQFRSDTTSSARYIFSTYLAPGGVYEVNISSQCREKINKKLKTLLTDDPIGAIRELEHHEINESIEDWLRTGALYHTYFANDSGAGMKKRDFGHPEEELQYPKGGRSLAGVVINQYVKSFNDNRKPELQPFPYPHNAYEQYAVLQIKDIYDSIVRIIHALHTQNDFRPKNVQDPYHSKISKHSTRGPGGGTSFKGGGHGHVHNIAEDSDDDGPLPPPPQLPDYYTPSSSPSPHSNNQLDGIIALLNSSTSNNAQSTRRRTAQPTTATPTTPTTTRRPHQQRQLDAVMDENGEITELDNDDEIDQTDVERIHINEWSYSRNPTTTAAAEEEQQEDIPAGWTLYDVIRNKFNQQESFRQQYNTALSTPLANPPEPPAQGRRRGGAGGRRGGRGGNNNQAFLDLENGQRLQHALMSYEWKIEACRRRVQRYTEVTDELVLVFDAAQLEIYKLMERDSFARFVKTLQFREFMTNHKFTTTPAVMGGMTTD